MRWVVDAFFPAHRLENLRPELLERIESSWASKMMMRPRRIDCQRTLLSTCAAFKVFVRSHEILYRTFLFGPCRPLIALISLDDAR